LQADEKLIIGGRFTTVNGVARNKLARLNTDGTLDTSFNADANIGNGNNYVVRSVQVLSDGKILVGGNFGPAPVGILRLLPDGSLDPTFTTLPGGFTEDYTVRQLPNGLILRCDSQGFKRLNNNGSPDASFPIALESSGSLSQRCQDLEVLPDGKFLVGGAFTAVNGVPRRGLARFNANSTLDTGFVPPPVPDYPPYMLQSMYTERVFPMSDGSVLFYNIDGFWAFPTNLSINEDLLRLDPNGNNLKQFDLSSSEVLAAVTLGDGKTLVSIGGMLRFWPDGERDLSLSGLSGAGTVNSFEVQSDGKVILAGTSGSVRRFIPEVVPPPPTPFDFDGDHKTDISVFRPSDSYWYQHLSTGSYVFTNWGLSTDKPAAGDYDNDGKADIGIYRDGVWYTIRSSDSTLRFYTFGQPGDIPYALDANNDHVTDLVLRNKTEDVITWKICYSGDFTTRTQFDAPRWLPGDVPVTGDFNGDGKADAGFYRNGEWYLRDDNGGNPPRHYLWGLAGDIPVPGDYDGDGRTDVAVYRPSTGVWYVERSLDGFYAVQWGISTDIPVPGDYDGDGKADPAVYRDGSWYLWMSTAGFGGEYFGLAGDIPIPSQNIYTGVAPRGATKAAGKVAPLKNR
jgi:uncharacterized delta-60 repeat protein